jgi:hypothetical protein
MSRAFLLLTGDSATLGDNCDAPFWGSEHCSAERTHPGVLNYYLSERCPYQKGYVLYASSCLAVTNKGAVHLMKSMPTSLTFNSIPSLGAV